LHAHEMVAEIAAIQMCRVLARSEGLLVGGSTGTVVAAVLAWRERIAADAVIVAISPDLGDRYLDTIYNDDWVTEKFGDAWLAADAAFEFPAPAYHPTPVIAEPTRRIP